MKKISIRRGLSKIWAPVILILTAGLALIWTGDSSLEERVITVRYFLFALAALIAFITPYILFPEKNVSVFQLGNLSAFGIREYVLNKVLILSTPIYLFIIFLYFADLQTPFSFLYAKFIFAVSSLIFYSAILIFSVHRYLKSGKSSQFWKESEKGRKLRENLANYFKYPLDPGSLPSLLNTILVFTTGAVLLVIGAVLQQRFTIYAEMILFLSMMLISIYLLVRNTATFVRNFYSTDAFFREFFGVSLKGEEVAQKREVEQLWWVPERLKMHVWQFMLQLDRKIPVGRAVAAGHVAVWVIAYQRPDPQFLMVIWILFAISHQLFTILAIQQEMAPHWMLRWIDDNHIWTLSRFWMQLRWIVPLLLSMNVQYFIFGVPGFYEQGIVVTIFLLSALLISLFGTIKLKQDLKT